MSGADLKKWMKQNDKTVVDVASATKIHPQTVQRFIDGKSVHASTRESFRRLITEYGVSNTGGQKAATVA